MDSKYKTDNKYYIKKKKYKGRRNIPGIVKILGLALLVFLAVSIGKMAGDFLYKNDSTLVQKVDVEHFKHTLNMSLPLINTVYNSGKVDFSLMGQVGNLINGIFQFDITEPLTILNSQSSIFTSYYQNGYQKMLAAQEKSNNIPVTPAPVTPQQPGKTGEQAAPEKNGETTQKPGQTPNGEEGVASSIEWEDDDQQKDYSNSQVVTEGEISITNVSGKKINLQQLIKNPLKLDLKKSGPKALIYHTHTTECYLSDIDDLKNMKIPIRSRDNRINVVRVGDEIATSMEKLGIDVIHNGTVHNYPTDISCYVKSYATATKILKSYPSIKVMLDIHRDGLGNTEKLRTVQKVNGKNAARVMIVIGVEHTGWEENLRFAIQIQKRLNQLAPGLAKPIYVRKGRFNQNMGPGALIVEVGGDGNLIGESVESAKYVGRAISDVMNGK